MNIHEKEQYEITIRENDKIIKNQKLFDPLHNTTITYEKGFKNAWKVLLHGLKYNVNINASREATNIIFAGDYSPLPVLSQSNSPNDTCQIETIN